MHYLKYVPDVLRINFKKTKIMARSDLVSSPATITVGTDEVQILGEEVSEKYLGRKLAVECCSEIEFENRLAAGWAAFHKH